MTKIPYIAQVPEIVATGNGEGQIHIPSCIAAAAQLTHLEILFVVDILNCIVLSQSFSLQLWQNSDKTRLLLLYDSYFPCSCRTCKGAHRMAQEVHPSSPVRYKTSFIFQLDRTAMGRDSLDLVSEIHAQKCFWKVSRMILNCRFQKIQLKTWKI